MGFIGAVKAGYTNNWNFTGRATRAECWWFALWYLILVMGCVPLALIAALSSHMTPLGEAIFDALAVVMGVAILASVIPLLSVQVRRLHDVGRTGYWVLAPYIFSGIALLLTHVARSVTGADLHTALLIANLCHLALEITLIVFLLLPSRASV